MTNKNCFLDRRSKAPCSKADLNNLSCIEHNLIWLFEETKPIWKIENLEFKIKTGKVLLTILADPLYLSLSGMSAHVLKCRTEKLLQKDIPKSITIDVTVKNIPMPVLCSIPIGECTYDR